MDPLGGLGSRLMMGITGGTVWLLGAYEHTY